MTLLTTLCAVGGGVCLLVVVGVAVLGLVLLLTRVVGKSKEQGVVFRDGLTREESDIVLGVISETFASKRVADTLTKVQAALTDAVAKLPK